MQIGLTRPTLSRADIINEINESDILGYYLGIKSIPTVINSPLRKDTNPSFALYSPNGIEVNYIDFSTGDSGGTISLLMKLWGLDRSKVYAKIQEDLLKMDKIECSKSEYAHRTSVRTENDLKLECKVREWKDYDLEYWGSYGISVKLLEWANVHPISHKIITKNERRFVFVAEKYSYVYVEHKEGKVQLKFYSPFSEHKWQTNMDKSVISLWSRLPQTGDKVCICSGLKDALTLMSHMHIPCIAPQGERYPISNTALLELKKRFKEIYVCYDNDQPGLEDAKDICTKHNLYNIVIPQFDGGKDISDYRKLFGKDKFIELFTKLFNNKNLTWDDELPF